MKKIIKASVFLIFLFPFFVFPGGDFEVINLEQKVVSGPDGDNDLYVSFKVKIKNLKENSTTIKIRVQGIDKDDFAVHQSSITGYFKKKEIRTLRVLVYINEENYKTIIKWEIQQ